MTPELGIFLVMLLVGAVVTLCAASAELGKRAADRRLDHSEGLRALYPHGPYCRAGQLWADGQAPRWISREWVRANCDCPLKRR